MGSGIAQVAAQVAKIPKVLLFDTKKDQLERQTGKISASLAKAVEKGKINTSEREQTMARLQLTSAIEDVFDADFIVEVKSRIAEKFSLQFVTF